MPQNWPGVAWDRPPFVRIGFGSSPATRARRTRQGSATTFQPHPPVTCLACQVPGRGGHATRVYEPEPAPRTRPRPGTVALGANGTRSRRPVRVVEWAH